MYPAPMLTVCVLALLAQVPQAAPAAARTGQDLSAQAAALRKIHSDGKPLDLRAYEAEIELTPVARDEDSHAVRFQVRYLRTDERRLLRYGTEEQGRRIERGLDRIGPWTRGDAAPISLLEAERAQELAEFRRHLRLAEQLARYLDPAALVDELAEPEVKPRVELDLGSKKQPHLVITGKHATLPLYYQAHEADAGKRQVAVELWIDEESGRLRALRTQPLDDQGKPTGLKEHVDFAQWVERDGRLLPKSLWISVEPDRERPQDVPAAIRVDVHKLLLDPELVPEDFDRKR